MANFPTAPTTAYNHPQEYMIVQEARSSKVLGSRANMQDEFRIRKTSAKSKQSAGIRKKQTISGAYIFPGGKNKTVTQAAASIYKNTKGGASLGLK